MSDPRAFTEAFAPYGAISDTATSKTATEGKCHALDRRGLLEVDSNPQGIKAVAMVGKRVCALREKEEEEKPCKRTEECPGPIMGSEQISPPKGLVFSWRCSLAGGRHATLEGGTLGLEEPPQIETACLHPSTGHRRWHSAWYDPLEVFSTPSIRLQAVVRWIVHRGSERAIPHHCGPVPTAISVGHCHHHRYPKGHSRGPPYPTSFKHGDAICALLDWKGPCTTFEYNIYSVQHFLV